MRILKDDACMNIRMMGEYRSYDEVHGPNISRADTSFKMKHIKLVNNLEKKPFKN